MIGIKVKRVGELYTLEFESYEVLLKYLSQNKPSQFSITFDGEKLTGSTPVRTYKVIEHE